MAGLGYASFGKMYCNLREKISGKIQHNLSRDYTAYIIKNKLHIVSK
jgi:hypothetical protein